MRPSLLRFVLPFLAVLSVPLGLAGPPDKSGVRPSAISLPSGAGSIEGLGESFEPQLNTGSSSYGVAIALPPGRAGLQPKVRLAYNSNLGNSSVGLGWSLEFPCIKRQTDKGFPGYTFADVFVFGGEELVPLSNPKRDWRCENESGFQRFRQIDTDGDFVPDAWEMTEPNGTRHIFGQHRGTGNRWSVVTHPSPPPAAQTSFDRTYCWALNTSIDLHGNRIEYEYLPPNNDPDSSNFLYPSRIRYSFLAGNYHEITFRYEDRPDKFDDYRPTFPVTIGKRVASVEVHSFYDGVDHLVRAYDLEYAYRPEDGIVTPSGSLDLGVSTLKRFVQRDRSGNTNNYLPPLLFEYSQMDPSAAQLNSIAPPELNVGESGGNVQIADVNGDSLPDIVKTADTISGEQIVCLNQGEFSAKPGTPKTLHFSSATVMVPSSSNFRLGDANSTLMDIDGDGLTDFVRIDPGDVTGKQMHFYRNNSRLDGRGTLGFSTTPQILFSAPPDIAFNDPSVRQMDVNFDKQSDFVLLQADFISSFFYYFRERDSGAWKQLGPVFFNPDMSGYGITFDTGGESNPHVHLADMNGDRLLDLVYLDVSNNGTGATLTVRYWPYCALGQWGAMRVMTLAAGDNFQVDAIDLRDVLVQDLTGDGLADIAILKSDGSGSSILDLRVNIAGRRWSAPFTKQGLPRHLPRDPISPTTFRQADLNANGSTDLIWRNQTLGDDSWQWLELLPKGKPNLLVRIDNSLGKQTEITYGNAVDDMIRARESGYPWQTWCPFPVQVVRRIRTTCGLDLDGLSDALGTTTDQYVSEFHYRDAFYDSFEREFRGFAFAERIDYGDDFLLDDGLPIMMRAPGWDPSKTPTGQVSGPTLVTRFRYLTGAADGIDNDEYPPGWNGIPQVDEITPKGGHEEEILKGRQVWEERIDPWVLHNPAGGGDFDRGCWFALNSSNTDDRTRMTPDNYVYSRARQEWRIRRLYRPNDPALAPPGRFSGASPSISVLDGLGGSGRSVSFAFVSAVTNEIIEANGILRFALSHPLRNPIITAKTSDFDDYGNQTQQRDFGVVSDASYDDERFTTTEYALQGEALDRWIIDRPSRVRITDENGVFVSETRNYYDGSPYQGLDLSTMGARSLLHRVEQVVTDTAGVPPLANQSDRPGDPRLPAGTVIQNARSSYDSYGNSIVMLDPLANPSSFTAGHARKIDYESTFRTYPSQETIMVGGGSPNLVASATYDLGFGVMTGSTDFNNNITSYEYDGFARLVSMVKPYDSTTFPTALFQYFPGDPNRSRVYSYDRAGNLTVESSGNFRASSRVVTRLRENTGLFDTYVTVSYMDGCGRKLAQVEESETAGHWIVSGAQSYNRRMIAQAEWLPYDIVSGSDDSSPPHFGQLWPVGRPPVTSLSRNLTVKTDRRYDPTGREIITINPAETLAALGNEAARTRSSTEFLPLEKRLFDENDNDPASPYANTPMVQFTDGLGRLIRVLEVVRLNDDGTRGGALNEWPTQYRYDLNDNLSQITDSQGNQKWFRHDGAKRKLFMNDPDRGTMSYTYDDASNLRSTIDAKTQSISYTYDGVNRLLTEDYLDAFNRSPDVAYHYDNPAGLIDFGDGTQGTPQNTKGRLAWVQDLSGEEHTSYDARGRASFVVKRIPDPLNGQLVSYRTGFAYDSLDRVNTLTYPDNDFVNYGYSSRTLLNQIAGGPSGFVISNILYQPSAQLSEIDYGNGVRTTYGYDPRLRLNTLITAPATNPASPLISFSYDFDGVSNIKSITDNRPGSVAASGDPRRNTQLFAYDDLYRITQAQYSFNTPGETARNDGQINYRYDRIGNMLAQTSTLSDTDPLTGLPVANLGTMNSGGASGRLNRIGRQPNDPPGPHALSQIVATNAPARNFAYDANGNMTVIDGLTNTWDFKDRLVAVENASMRARYTYDYTDRRITKQVFTRTNGVAPASPTLTTLYIDKYFEVRDHDAPVKYVWNRNTRVARVTGSLNSSQRVQRGRLWPGYNLISVAVNGATLPASPGLTAYLWNPGTLNWQTVATGTALAAGSVLWVQAATNGVLTFTGNYSDPTNSPVAGGPSFLPVPGLEVLNLSTNSYQLSTNQWHYDAQNQLWQIVLAVPLASFNSLPPTLAPGEVLFVRADAATQLTPTDPTLRVRYYHEDHIGSSSFISDSAGQLVEDNFYYPFGDTRISHQYRSVAEHYTFAQKEKDSENGLYYFESRFLIPSIGRFSKPDNVYEASPSSSLANPQSFNIYSYCGNKPIVSIDPTGCAEEAITEASDGKAQTQSSGGGSSHDDERSIEYLTEGIKSTLDVTERIATPLGSSKRITETTADKILSQAKMAKELGFDKDSAAIMGKLGKVAGTIMLVADIAKAAKICDTGTTKDCAKEVGGLAASQLTSKLTFIGCEGLAAASTGPGALGTVAVCSVLGATTGYGAGKAAEQIIDWVMPNTRPTPIVVPMCKP
jgi:RHS repeat-associated protein